MWNIPLGANDRSEESEMKGGYGKLSIEGPRNNNKHCAAQTLIQAPVSTTEFLHQHRFNLMSLLLVTLTVCILFYC